MMSYIAQLVCKKDPCDTQNGKLVPIKSVSWIDIYLKFKDLLGLETYKQTQHKKESDFSSEAAFCNCRSPIDRF